jgi:hypothetical protein
MKLDLLLELAVAIELVLNLELKLVPVFWN